MDLSDIRHIDASELAAFEPDVFISTLRHESRSTCISREMEGKDCRKIVLVPEKLHRGHAYSANLRYFEEQGFEKYSSRDSTPDLEKLLGQGETEDFKLFLDCTGMPPTWNHSYFNWFSQLRCQYRKAVIRVSHCQSAYEVGRRIPKLKRLDDFLFDETRAESTRSSGKKTALLLGMGHEQGVSQTILSTMKPDLLFLLYADPAVDRRFVEDTFINNSEVIEANSIRRLKNYPANNGKECYQVLVDTILPLRNEYQIQIIPHGPKVLSLATLLLHQAYPDIRISYPTFRNGHFEDRDPHGDRLVMDLLFE